MSSSSFKLKEVHDRLQIDDVGDHETLIHARRPGCDRVFYHLVSSTRIRLSSSSPCASTIQPLSVLYSGLTSCVCVLYIDNYIGWLPLGFCDACFYHACFLVQHSNIQGSSISPTASGTLSWLHPGVHFITTIVPYYTYACAIWQMDNIPNYICTPRALCRLWPS